MTTLKKLIVILVGSMALHSPQVNANDSRLLTAHGGQLEFTFYRANVRDAGLSLEGVRPSNFQHDVATIRLQSGAGLKFRTRGGYFQELERGSIGLEPGLTVSGAGWQLSTEQLVLEPMAAFQPALQLSDRRGRQWFYLDYGHYERDGQWLHARYLDVRIGHELARVLGDPGLHGFLIGSAMLQAQITEPLVERPRVAGGIGADCPVSDPNWPTLPGFEADIAMLRLDSVSQVVREGGQVALAPSAYFENIGNADVPWFAQFADTRDVDACCADQGNGVCAPYGNDQGGMLVYHLYRFSNGRLEQLGQSQVKHAFNSINADTGSGSVSCRAPNRPGRVVPAGCEDLYQVSSNADQAYLGPRDEIIAHTGIWQRDGSIWDLTGPQAVPDGNCDYLPGLLLYGGQVPCLAPVSGVMDRRLSVAESTLSTPGARYFIEAWYLVRDDVNIFNSIGRKEITPTFTSVWTFPAAADFQQGPVIDDYPALQNANAGSMTDRVDSGEGSVELASSVSQLAPDQWQYDYTLMNFDFDRAISGFEMPIAPGVTISGAEFFDGDTDSGNDWSASVQSEFVRFEAPAGVKLKWGSLVSFRFLADQPPNTDTATLAVADAGEPAGLSVSLLTSSDVLQDDGFE